MKKAPMTRWTDTQKKPKVSTPEETTQRSGPVPKVVAPPETKEVKATLPTMTVEVKKT